MDETDRYFTRFRDFMVGGFPEIIRSVVYEGELVPYINGVPTKAQPSPDLLAIELAKINQAIEAAKADQEHAKAQQLQAQVQLQIMSRC